MALRCLLTSTIIFSLTYVLLPLTKKKRKRLLFWTILTGVIATTLITILYHFTSDNPTLLSVLFVPLLLVDGFFLLFFFTKGRLTYALFCFVLAMVVYLIIGFPTEALKNAIVDNDNLANGLYLIARSVLLALLFSFFLLFLRPRFLKVESEIGQKWTIPLILSTLVLLLLVFVGVFPTDWSKRDSSNYYLIGYLGVFVAGFYISIYLFIRDSLKQKHKELDEQAMNKKIEAMECKINQDEAYQKIIDKKEHDLHHHIAVLKSLLENGQYPEALIYLREYDQQATPFARPYHSGSFALDAILSMYLARFKEEGVAFDCRLVLPPDCPLLENEIIGLFANALENANNGVLVVNKEKPFVSLSGQESKGFYVITLKNSAKPVSFKNGIPLRKDASRGIGSQNIVDILNRHNGFYSFDYQDDVFIFEGAIPLEAPHERR